MAAEQYTLVLTKGVHVISRTDAEEIIQAVHDDRPTVEVYLDLFGGYEALRKTTLVTRHVVAVTENAEIREESTALAVARRRRQRP